MYFGFSMKNCNKFIKLFIEEESGQSTLEYIMIMGIIVMVILRFKGIFQNVIEQAGNQLQTNVGQALQQTN